MKIVIVGGVAGGASAAARARRLDEQAEIVVLERGPEVSFANCGLPYHIGQEIADRSRLLLQTPESLHRRFHLDVRVLQEALSVEVENRRVLVRNLRDGSEYYESYDHLVLATGAAPLIPPIEGRERAGVFTLRDLSDMDRIIDWQRRRAKNGHAVVVGAGFIGLEMAEQLHRLGMKVTVVEAAPQVLPPLDPEMAFMVQRELVRNDVRVEVSEFVSVIEAKEGLEVGEVVAKSGLRLPADLVILSVGVRPNTDLAKTAQLRIGPSGGIEVNDSLQTSVDRIWAVGDVIETSHLVLARPGLTPLGGPANRQGRIVASNILGRPLKYRGSLGTAIVRVFELTAAVTGASEKLLSRYQNLSQSVYLHPASHASYYPGASAISMKLIFEPESGAVLGAQAVGRDGVDKRIDVLATAISAGMTVDDLTDLELCYAPPFGSAKDPVNLAGMVAQNVRDGLVELESPVGSAQDEDILYLDVRSATERQAGMIEPSLHIPVDELRGRLSELPHDKILIVYCQSGQRSYIACRILMQHGFRCRNLSGAYLSWSQKA